MSRHLLWFVQSCFTLHLHRGLYCRATPSAAVDIAVSLPDHLKLSDLGPFVARRQLREAICLAGCFIVSNRVCLICLRLSWALHFPSMLDPRLNHPPEHASFRCIAHLRRNGTTLVKIHSLHGEVRSTTLRQGGKGVSGALETLLRYAKV